MACILKEVHDQSIIHRDVKPANFLVTRGGGVRLTDFGLSEFYEPGKTMSPKVASRYYKAPELLLGKQDYDFKVDCWGFGVIMAGLIFRKEPFFMADTNPEQLDQIVKLLGTPGLVQAAKEINIHCPLALIKNIHQKGKLESLINPNNATFATPDALSLIEKLLVYDSKNRLSMADVLAHPYFQEEAKARR
jgi:casein kinase II subunit alpha